MHLGRILEVVRYISGRDRRSGDRCDAHRVGTVESFHSGNRRQHRAGIHDPYGEWTGRRVDAIHRPPGYAGAGHVPGEQWSHCDFAAGVVDRRSIFGPAGDTRLVLGGGHFMRADRGFGILRTDHYER
jgi:hypothetical protein